MKATRKVRTGPIPIINISREGYKNRKRKNGLLQYLILENAKH